MKRIFTFLLFIIMAISSLSIFACGKPSGDVGNLKYRGEVVLIDVKDLTSFDVATVVKSEDKKAVSEASDLTWKLTSVATNTVFVFDNSVVQLDDIYREYYILEVLSGEEQIATAKLDFYDIENDGVIWCEMNEYTVGAVRTDAESEITFEYQHENFYQGTTLTARPINPRYWRFAYYAIMPFHSKEYYLEFTNDKSIFEISYIRKATYNDQSWNFDKKTMAHLNGKFPPERSVINVRYFGCGGNVSSTGAMLNTEQSLTFRMSEILGKFEVLGRHGEGHGNYWYFVGTCHDAGNPYKIEYFFQYIDILQY